MSAKTLEQCASDLTLAMAQNDAAQAAFRNAENARATAAENAQRAAWAVSAAKVELEGAAIRFMKGRS